MRPSAKRRKLRQRTWKMAALAAIFVRSSTPRDFRYPSPIALKSSRSPRCSVARWVHVMQKGRRLWHGSGRQMPPRRALMHGALVEIEKTGRERIVRSTCAKRSLFTKPSASAVATRSVRYRRMLPIPRFSWRVPQDQGRTDDGQLICLPPAAAARYQAAYRCACARPRTWPGARLSAIFRQAGGP